MLRFGNGRNGTIGLDIEQDALKAVQVIAGSEGYILQHVGYHRLPEGVISDGEVADSELLAREIQEFWNLHSFRGKAVILAVSGSNVLVRFVDFPRLSPEDLKSALSFHAEEHIPIPIDDVVLDHIVLGPSPENPEEDRVLLVAAQRAMVEAYTASVKLGGLRPAGVDVKALALTRSTLPEVLFDDEETVLLLDIGTEISNLVVVQGRSPTLTQFLQYGFRDFAESVALTADLERDEAERQALNPLASLGALPEDGENTTLSPDEAQTLELDPVEPEDELPESGEDSDERDKGGESQNPTRDAEEDGEDEGEAPEEEVFEPEEPEDAPDGGEPAEAGDHPPTSGPLAESADSGEEEPAQESAYSPPEDAETEEIHFDPALIYDVRRGLEDAAGRLAEEVERAIEYHNSRPQAREVSRVMISGEGALVRGLDSYLGELLGLRVERANPASRLASNRSNISDEQLSAMEPVLAVALGIAMDEE